MPQARSIWAMIRCGPGGETAAPATMAPRYPCPAAAGSRPSAFASAAFGHGDRLGILRVQGALVIHVVLHNNNTGGTGTAVLQCTLQYFCSTGQYQRLVPARFDRPGDLVTKTKMWYKIKTKKNKTKDRTDLCQIAATLPFWYDTKF